VEFVGNFEFLTDPLLARLCSLAERYFGDDPGTAIFKLRQFSELLCKTVAAHHALYRDNQRLTRCSDGYLRRARSLRKFLLCFTRSVRLGTGLFTTSRRPIQTH
jgi:hypothetical protein